MDNAELWHQQAVFEGCHATVVWCGSGIGIIRCTAERPRVSTFDAMPPMQALMHLWKSEPTSDCATKDVLCLLRQKKVGRQNVVKKSVGGSPTLVRTDD